MTRQRLDDALTQMFTTTGIFLLWKQVSSGMTMLCALKVAVCRGASASSCHRALAVQIRRFGLLASVGADTVKKEDPGVPRDSHS
jgi:hypothetical protein